MKKLIVLCMLITGLFSNDYFFNEWSKENETKFYYFMGLQALDVASTKYALNNGAIESNPLLGKNPSTEKLLLSKAIMIPVVYGLLELQNEEWKGYTLNVINFVYVGVVGNNVYLGLHSKF